MRLSDAVLSLVTVAAEIFVLSGAIWGQTTRSQAVTQYVSETTGKTIDQLVESALKNNGDLRSTRQRIAEAQGLLTQSRLRINPTLDASFGNGRVVNSPGERAFGIGYAHTFELGGKRDRRVAVADLGVQLTSFSTADRERLLKAAVKMRFIEALAAARNLESAEQMFELNSQSYQIAQARTRQGEGTPLEEGLLRVEVSRIASDRLLFANQIERAVLELKTLAGLRANDTLKIAGSLSAPKISLSQKQAVSRALEERSDLKAVRIEELLGGAETQQARSEAIPNLVVSTRYSRTGSTSNQYGLSAPGGTAVPIRNSDNLLTTGVSINLPTRNRNQGNIQAAVARQQSASLRRTYLDSVVRQEVQAALTRYETAAKALGIFDEGVLQQSRENVRILRAAYDLGEIRLIDVINEQRRLVDTQRAYTDLLRESFLAAIELERAIGAPLF
ncbi:MAG: TolC family protein [Acidobacteria bacterium]|nr:TolC family protein [Acidobacteriota bacterium]